MSDLSVRAVADELSVTTETVRRLIKTGDLPAYRLGLTGGPWRVTPAALAEFKELRAHRDPWVRSRPRRTA